MDSDESAIMSAFFARCKAAVAVAKAKGAKFNTIATVAQAAHESGFGQSWLAMSANNLFGVKATDAEISLGDVVMLPTREYQNGKWVRETAYWVKYPSWNESIVAYAELINSLPWFHSALTHADRPDGDGSPQAWLMSLELPGRPDWATDPQYVMEVAALFNGVARWLT